MAAAPTMESIRHHDDDGTKVHKIRSGKPFGHVGSLASTADTASLGDFHHIYSSDGSAIDGDTPMASDEEISVEHVVLPFQPAGLQQVKLLQEAKRNKGQVNLMRYLDDGHLVAVKRMPNKWVTGSHKEFTKRSPYSTERPWYDIGILRYLNELGFKHCCTLEAIYRDEAHTYVATSFADQGDLFDWSGASTTRGDEQEVTMRPLVRQIMDAVLWLHDHGIAHRDLSLENVLLCSSPDSAPPYIKLIDFGMATTARHASGPFGKESYQAPEMHMPGKLYNTYLVDTFAIGVIVFGMAAADYPWQSTRKGSCELYDYIAVHGLRKFLTLRRVRGGRGEVLQDVMSEGLTQLLEALLITDPLERATLGERCFEAEDRKSVRELAWLAHEAL